MFWQKCSWEQTESVAGKGERLARASVTGMGMVTLSFHGNAVGSLLPQICCLPKCCRCHRPLFTPGFGKCAVGGCVLILAFDDLYRYYNSIQLWLDCCRDASKLFLLIHTFLCEHKDRQGGGKRWGKKRKRGVRKRQV